jgi:GNAT superfamily N-acetyltransferase
LKSDLDDKAATGLTIRQASTAQEIALARELFGEYAAWLAERGADLSLQAFAAELAGLPGLYAPPRGRLLLAWAGRETSGTVALRPIGESVCEMKRLYVRPAFRGLGFGRKLAQWIIAEARAIGYATMKLDTLPLNREAIQLYRELGFTECPPYHQSPYAHTIFMELDL